MTVTQLLAVPTPPRPPWYRRRGLLAAGVLLVTAGLGVGFAAGHLSSQPPAKPPAPTHAIPAGLSLGDVVAGSGSTGQVAGVQVGYARTPDGAVQAATNYAVARNGPLMFNQDSRPELIRTIYAPGAVDGMIKAADYVANKWAQGIPLDANGNVLDPATKQPLPQLTFYARIVPQDGAYKLISFSPDEAKVTLWEHYLIGPGNDTDTHQVVPFWQTETYTLRWIDGDWKITGWDGAYDNGPLPAVRSLSPPSLAERARLVPGFTLYANTTGR